MTTGAFTDFLIAEIEATESTAFVEALLAKARTKILAGGGSLTSLTSGSQNGKSYQGELSMDAAQVATACRAALDYTADEQQGVSCSRLDFSNL